MRCDVAIPIEGHWHLARPCIEAVLRRTRAEAGSIHLVESSGDPFIEAEVARFARTYPRRIRVHRIPPGAPAVDVVNACLDACRGDLAAVVAIDTIVTRGWLEALIRAFEADATLGMASPLAHSAHVAAMPMLAGTDASRMGELLARHAAGEVARGVAPEPHCFAVRQSVIARTGGFDALYAGVQDALEDLVQRAARLSYGCATVLDGYVYRRGDFSRDSELPGDRRARSRELYLRRWKPDETAAKVESLERVRERLEALTRREVLDFERVRSGPLRVDDRLHVLCILPTLNPYGGVISVVNLLNELCMRGHRCTLVSLSECSRHRHTLQTQPDWVSDWKAIPEQYAGDYDVVLATSWETVGYAGAIAAASPRAHAMYFIQDLEDTFYPEDDPRRGKVIETYPSIPTKFAKTSYLCDEMAARGWPTHRIRPGMNLDLFYPHVRGRGRAATILGMVRWGHLHRGYDLVLAVLANVMKSRPEVEIILFGSDDIPRDQVGFEHEIAGRVAPSELPSLYSRADIFLEMSRHHGFGRTGVEAMACGAACVMSDSGGLGEYVIPGENALLVRVEDVDAATRAVERLVDDAALRERLVSNGFKTVSRYAEPLATDDFLGLVYRTHPAFQERKERATAHA